MKLFDPERPFQRKRHAGSAVLCSQHDNLCHSSYLYLVYFDFNGIDRE